MDHARYVSCAPLGGGRPDYAEKVYDAARFIDRALKASGTPSPRIAVAGLNPHAGEGGLLGTEEIREIGPGIERARAEGIAAAGPFPADTVFIAASRGVTLLAGLPVPITTPAHGTAFDIAGKGIASVGPIREAFAIAKRLSAADKTP